MTSDVNLSVTIASERFSLVKQQALSKLGVNNVDGKLYISGIARLGHTAAGDLCFCDKEPSGEFRDVAAGSIILCTETLLTGLKSRFPESVCIALTDPRSVFIDIGHKLLADSNVQVADEIPRPFGTHATTKIGLQTVIHPEVRIDENVTVGANCVIHRGTWIKSGAVIRDNTTIGAAGINAYTGVDGKQRSFPHLAGIVIGKNVEIGAGAVIVRGILNNTRIGNATVIGNLCNIGHVADIGEKVWMSVGCLIGGHSKIGTRATLGMGVAVRDNIEIGANAQVGMASVVVKSVKANSSVFGNPARVIGPIQAGPLR